MPSQTLEQKRRVAREYAQRKRDAQWIAKARAATTCPHGHGPGRCGGRLEERTDGLGHLVLSCPQCDRRRAGICRVCPAKVYGRAGTAIYCALHKRLAVQAQTRKSNDRHRAARNAQAREAAQRPDVRARRNAYKKAYRQAHPDRVKRHKRREALKQSKRSLEYHRRYNAMRRDEKAALAREQYYATHPVPQPTCRSCSRAIPWQTRGTGGQYGRPPVRCVFCMAREQLYHLTAAIRRWVKSDEVARTPKVQPALPKLRIRRPYPTRHNAAGERLCFTATCETVVRGRAKKCEACRARELTEARERLGLTTALDLRRSA